MSPHRGERGSYIGNPEKRYGGLLAKSDDSCLLTNNLIYNIAASPVLEGLLFTVCMDAAPDGGTAFRLLSSSLLEVHLRKCGLS